jgi:hypothetical protein
MMRNHLFVPLTALVLLACTPAPERATPKDQQAAKSEPKPAPAKPEPKPASSDEPDYASFGMPSADAPWSNADYTDARQAVTAIAKADTKLLPRDGSPTFARMADVEHLRTLASSVAPEQLAGLSLSLGFLHMVYGDRVREQPEFEREQLMLTAAVLVVTSKLPATTASDEAQALALRSDPSRLKGMLRFRHGIYEMVADMLEPAPNSVLARAVGCEQLARVIGDAAPLLLEEERTSLREQLRGCEGASAEVIARLEQALASEAPTAALVTTLLPEHREYKSTH